MRKLIFGAGLMLSLLAFMAFTPASQNTNSNTAPDAEINWLTWEEAMTAMEASPKKMFIDVYTDWCGWCKRMDASTFSDPDVIEFMNEHYYAVKMNAEGKGDKEYLGKTYVFRSDVGRRGAHELAIALLKGQMSYPSMVYLGEDQRPVKVSMGYKTPEAILAEMQAMASVDAP